MFASKPEQSARVGGYKAMEIHLQVRSRKQHRVHMQPKACAPRRCGAMCTTATCQSKALKLEGDSAPAQLQELYQALVSAALS